MSLTRTTRGYDLDNVRQVNTSRHQPETRVTAADVDPTVGS